MTTGHRVGKHRIQGISDEFIPPIVDLASLDPVVSVDDGDAILNLTALYVAAQRTDKALEIARTASMGQGSPELLRSLADLDRSRRQGFERGCQERGADTFT